jgi:hypothetical protein
MSGAMMLGRRTVVVVAAVFALTLSGLSGCSKGQTLRGTTSLAVKAALKDNKVDYKGSITCAGNDLPINCTGTASDGSPIAGSLSNSSGNSCVLVVNVASKQIAKETGAKCK